jgi:DNA repair exonuclease SbcCD ATPase subunit
MAIEEYDPGRTIKFASKTERPYLRPVPPAANNQPLLLNKRVSVSNNEHITNVRLLQATGVLVSIIWLVGASFYIQRMIGWQNISGLKPHEMGGFLAGILTPVALFWMVAAFIMRSNDVKMYAEALREEIQGMIFPSEEANRRVNNDIERLMRQTSEMTRATNIALSAIETAREGLRTQVNLLNTGSTETVDRLTTLGLSLNARMHDVTQIGEQLEQSLGKIEQSTVIAGEKLGETNKQLQQSAELIGSNTQTAENAVDRISQMLRERLEALGSLHLQTEEALQSAVSEIVSQRENLKLDAQDLESKAVNIGDTLRKGTDKLYAFSDDALDKAKLIETKLEGQTVSLQNVLAQANDNASQIETATTEAVIKMQNTVSDTTNEVSKIEDVLEQAINRLKDATKGTLENTTEILEKATDKLTTEIDLSSEKARKELQDAIAFISGATEDTLSNITSTMEENADRFTRSLDDTGNRIETKLNDAHQSLDQAVANLNQRSIDTAKQVHDSMEVVTDRLVGSIDQIGTRTKNMTDEMLTEVNRKVGDTTAAFAYIQNQIQALVTLFDQRKMQLDETGTSARQTAEAMHTTLQAALDKVQKTADVLQSGIGAINVSVQEPIRLLENVATMAHQRAGDIAELLTNRTENITQSVRKMGEDANEVQQNLQTKSQDVALLAGKIASHLKMLGQEVDMRSETLDQRLSQSIHSLDSLNTAQKNIAQDIGKLHEQTAQTTDLTTASSETIQQRIELLQQLHKSLAVDSDASKASLDRVSDRIVTISTGTLDNIKNTLENMTLLEADYHRMSEAGVDSIERLETGYRDTLGVIKTETEETAQKIMGLQNDLQNTTLQSNHFMQAHLSNLQQTANNFHETIHKVSNFGDTIALHTDRIDSLGGEFLKGNEQISINVRSLQDVLGQMKDHTIEAVDSFMQHGVEVENHLQSQIARLNNVNQNFILNTNEVKNMLAQNVDNSEDLSQKITIQIHQLRNEGEAVESTLNNVLDRISSANSELVEQNQEINAVGDEMLNRLQQATQQIGNKAAALEKAAEDARVQAEALRNQEQKLNQEAFFNSTKFIVESLHSLALDFTRMMDGELNEKTWRAYQKGDTGAFTKRLLSSRDEDTQTKMRNKFKDDVEFRTYVQRYLRQFEEIYDSAERNDHAHLLTSIFATSDVGKLYQFICGILDRDARGIAKA